MYAQGRKKDASTSDTYSQVAVLHPGLHLVPSTAALAANKRGQGEEKAAPQLKLRTQKDKT
jgi:hypothetical protein